MSCSISLATSGVTREKSYSFKSYWRTCCTFRTASHTSSGTSSWTKQGERFRTDRGRRFDKYDVVDGQQQLTSAAIFLHVAAQFGETVADTLDENNLISPVAERPRLLQQDQDKEYFRNCLLGSATIDTQTPSQERLKRASEFFEREFEGLDGDRTIRELAEKLRYDCRVNVVEIDNGSEAASIFESLNDRGRPLSTLDKTKSFLMYMDDRSSNEGALEEKIKDRFGSIYRELFVLSIGHERVSDFDEDSFLRFHWGMYDATTRTSASGASRR